MSFTKIAIAATKRKNDSKTLDVETPDDWMMHTTKRTVTFAMSPVVGCREKRTVVRVPAQSTRDDAAKAFIKIVEDVYGLTVSREVVEAIMEKSPDSAAIIERLFPNGATTVLFRTLWFKLQVECMKLALAKAALLDASAKLTDKGAGVVAVLVNPDTAKEGYCVPSSAVVMTAAEVERNGYSTLHIQREKGEYIAHIVFTQGGAAAPTCDVSEILTEHISNRTAEFFNRRIIAPMKKALKQNAMQA